MSLETTGVHLIFAIEALQLLHIIAHREATHLQYLVVMFVLQCGKCLHFRTVVGATPQLRQGLLPGRSVSR